MIEKIWFVLSFFLIFCTSAPARAETPYTEGKTGMEFVFIPGGCFAMGDSVGDGDPNERPVHEVCVSGLYIGKYEVTNKQFKAFKPDHNSGQSRSVNLDEENDPVVNVSWEDAVAYAEWLSDTSGEEFRLPTEAEWEHAARAGSAQSHFWGNSTEEACIYANVADISAKKQRKTWTAFNCDDGYPVVAPVGSFKANGFGLYDVLGNVWEWCQDVYNSEAYTKLPKDNPCYTGSGEYRVMRGGCWSNGPLGVRSSHRVGLSPDFSHQSLGFRLVRSTQKAQ